MTIEALIFDLDGTMADTEEAVVLSEAGILDVPEVLPRANQAEMSPGAEAREFAPLRSASSSYRPVPEPEWQRL